MRIRTFLLLSLLLFVRSLTADPTNSPLVTNPGGSTDGTVACNFPPPDNFHISGSGVDWIQLSWNIQFVAPPFYRLRTFETVSGNLVDVRDVPGTANTALIPGLNQATSYTVRINALCSDGTEGETYGTDSGSTIILDLVVSGFSNEGSSPSCGVYSQDAYCLFDQSAFQGTVFRIVSLQQSASYRKFLVRKVGEEHFNVTIRPSENSSGYTFECVGGTAGSSPPSCFSATKIAIYYNSTYIGSFDLSEVREGKSTLGHLTCKDNLGNFQIQRMAPAPGFAAGSDDRSEFTQELPVAQKKLTTSPNPFSDLLSVELNFPDEKAPVALNLYDLQGRLVVSKNCEGGQQTQTLFTESLAPGMYFLHVQAAGETQVLKVMKTQ